ncbi:RNA-guided endonuclease TnpB family protein [Streptomyces sp. NPDC007162]|uniref:RNA-guided endonuclease InsQ/TnpB family protein n=1 Tax=Streptomyces sp. NPDC007162 TaxID=3156917 RepID=UPI0033CECED3
MPATDRTIGIDLGLTHFAVLSDGTKIDSPRFLRRAELISENQGIAVEDLSVVGLARTRLAKSVHDAGWASFLSMLEYKASRYGRVLVKIGRFEPTSQTCSTCGGVDGPKPLNVREWTCRACGTVHDRDHNAAINVKTAAGPAVSACGAPVRPGAIPAQREETGSHALPTGNRAA